MKVVFWIGCLLALGLSGCAKSAFEEATQEGTLAGYAHFLREYPESDWSAQARTEQEELLFQSIKQKPSLSQIKRFRALFPQSPHRLELSQLKESLLMAEARETGLAEKYRAYQADFPNGRFIGEVNTYLQTRAIRRAREEGALSGFAQLFQSHPEVRVTLQAEAEALGAAQMSKHPSKALRDLYLKLFPLGEHKKQVLGAYEEFRFFEVQKAHRLPGYADFLKEFPASRFGAQVQKQQVRLWFAQAKDSHDSKKIRAFLLAFPQSGESLAAWSLLVTWNVQQLLKTHQCPGCDLKGADLAGQDLSSVDLRKAVLVEANFKGANLSNANLAGAVLTGANFSRAVWTDQTTCAKISLGLCARYKEADLKRLLATKSCPGCELHGAPLEGAHLEGANLAQADLRFAKLGLANLKKANLDKANLIGAQLGGSNLRFATLVNANLSHANLDQAVMKEVDLTGGHVAFASFNGTDLRRAVLNHLQFVGNSMRRVDLRRAELEEAAFLPDPKTGHLPDLTSADFRWAFLQKAQLEVHGAAINFGEAHLQGVRFKTSELIKPDFRGADLTDSDIDQLKITDPLFDEAIWNDGHTCLKGSVGRCIKDQ